MGCAIIALEKGDCGQAFGGIEVSYAINASDIEDITFDGDGNVTAFTLAGGGTFAKWEFSRDDSAFYNQEGARTGNLLSYTQTTFVKSPGITVENQNWVDGVVDCCEVVLVNFLSSGQGIVQGIEYDKDNDIWKVARNSAKAAPNIMSDTGENEARTELNVVSVSNRRSPLTTLTIEDMDGLAGAA